MRERQINVRGLDVHCLEWGERGAPPVVLIHGGSAHAHWWDAFAPTIADHFHVLAPDLRGHGDSAWVDPPAYAVDDYAGDVVELVRREGWPTVRLVGHSLGGLVAVTAAARLDASVRAVVTVDARTRPSDLGLRSLHRLAQMPAPRWASRDDAVARFRLLPDDGDVRPELRAHVATHALRQDPQGAWTHKFDRAALAAISAVDVAPALASLACPVLVVRGGESRIMSDRAVAILREAKPDLRIETIAGAGHHVMLDRPEEFASLVGPFLRAIG